MDDIMWLLLWRQITNTIDLAALIPILVEHDRLDRQNALTG
jgi:hypothetical protein